MLLREMHNEEWKTIRLQNLDNEAPTAKISYESEIESQVAQDM